MINLKELQSVLHNVQQVMAGYSQDDTWSDYDKQSHAELIKMQYIVEGELKDAEKETPTLFGMSNVEFGKTRDQIIEYIKMYKEGIPIAAYKIIKLFEPFVSNVSYLMKASYRAGKREIKCDCNNEIKTGQTSVMCCNLCGKPDEDFWNNF